jgi:hypothetical protein
MKAMRSASLPEDQPTSVIQSGFLSSA